MRLCKNNIKIYYMDFNDLINDFLNIKLSNIQFVFFIIIYILTILIVIYLTRLTCCKNCIELKKYDNNFKNQQF